MSSPSKPVAGSLPAAAADLMMRAGRHLQAGEREAAESLCRQVLARWPETPEAFHLLATAAHQKRDLAAAESHIRRALALSKGNPIVHFVLANILRDQQRFEDAIAAFRHALQLKPDFHQALNNLGNLYKSRERNDEALDCYQRALALDPNYALAHYNKANILRDLGRMDEALTSFRQAIALKPDYFDAINNLGNALQDLDRLEESVECYESALKVRPDSAEVLNNCGNSLRELNRLEEADAAYARAVAAAPELADAHFGHALVLLMRGDYLNGWREYEWRWKCADFPSDRYSFSEPEWNGESFAGRTLLVHFEQGYGDNLQLLRYVPMVMARGGRVILQLQKPLLRLASTLRGAPEIIGPGPRPPFDLRCSIMALPRIFATTLQTIPAEVPYLFADPALTGKWRERLGDNRGLRVGIVWAGNPRQKTEPKRGVGLEAYRPLFSVPGTSWFSLQVGPRAADISQLAPGTITDLSGELTDYAETAAALANLDLVITSDTSVAHLAGALNRPVWVMLRWCPDWRYGTSGDRCPWYPSMRLFRQSRRAHWEDPVAAACAALGELSSRRS